MSDTRYRCLSCGGTYQATQSGARYFHVCPPARSVAPGPELLAVDANAPPMLVAVDNPRNENIAPDFTPPPGKRVEEYVAPMISEGAGVEEIPADE